MIALCSLQVTDQALNDFNIAYMNVNISTKTIKGMLLELQYIQKASIVQYVHDIEHNTKARIQTLTLSTPIIALHDHVFHMLSHGVSAALGNIVAASDLMLI